MKRTKIVFIIGACVAVAGVLLTLGADSLATKWQSMENGRSWSIDPAARTTYSTIGVTTLAFGLVLLAGAAWNWMAEEFASRA